MVDKSHKMLKQLDLRSGYLHGLHRLKTGGGNIWHGKYWRPNVNSEES